MKPRPFCDIVITWYHRHKRDLPWRRTRNPYFIWLSEVILQQTRVDQGLAYYKRFVKTFPTVKKLAAAREEQVLKLWQGLGYYSRARNLHQAAKQIMKMHKGKFPGNYEDILQLKGVGEYTAAAIASIAYHLPYPVVDGNVFRLLSRYLGIRTPIDASGARREFTEAARELMDTSAPYDFNQAIMEFGSRVCKPANPDCLQCPLNASCMAFEKGWVAQLPVKAKKQKVRKRYFHYLHIVDGSHTWMRRREGQDIWKNLYEFPLLEVSAKRSAAVMLTEAARRKLIPPGARLDGKARQYRHLLSHQEIVASFHRITAVAGWKIPEAKKVSRKQVSRLPVHRLMEKYLEDI